MKIIELDFNNPKHKKQFKQFPFELYQSNPNWVPAFDGDMNLALNPAKHPYYKHSEAKFYMAISGSEILGRLTAINNINYANYHNEAVGFFYYFESINDKNVSSALFDEALSWFKSRGVTRIIGPKGLLRSNGMGCLIKGFDFLPAVGIPYNHDYYDQLITDYGFTKHNDHHSGYLYAENKLPEKLYLIAERVKQKGDYWVKSFRTRHEMLPWIEAVDKVHHEAFHKNHNYYPSTPEEFELLANNIRQIANPSMIKLIMHKEDVAGFVIAYPNISRAIQQCKGKVFPFGWLTLKQAMHKTELIDGNGVGLLPKYQGRGANALLYTELEKTLRGLNAKQMELIQVDERNFKSKSDMEFLGIDWQKTHRTYQLIIE